LGQVGALIDQTVIWQLGRRGHADLYHRLSSVIAYWLLLNPLGLVALRRRRRPLWLPVGFCLGATFLLTAQAYYHYFALVVPFAALLAAPVVTSLARRRPRLLVACLLCLACLWGLDVGYGPPVLRLHVTASRLTPVRQTAAILDRATRPNETILTDEFEYALMAHRPLAANYFWDMEGMVQARSLEEQLAHLAAVVTTKGSEGYPRGFVDYLEDMHYPSVQTPRTIVWLIRSTS
jgi:phosphoglycerol transferase MdoB-like AlkP superfamily enzyme